VNQQSPSAGESRKKIRYAVVGLGHIAQVAVLPAFENVPENTELAALVSDDPKKLEELSEKYRVKKTCSYDEYDALLKSGDIDAVYIALPNHLHCEYTVRAAEAGIHILCEKPMAVTEDECEKMIHAAEVNNVKLMIAYRLHFEEANLRAIEICRNREIGEPRIFNSVFTMNVKEGDIRLQSETGGGTLYDIGIYCLNAARYLLQDEPIEVMAFSANSGDERFKEVDEMTTAILRFPNERLASFTTSFGAANVSTYRVVGTKGDLRVDPAYAYASAITHYVTIDGDSTVQEFAKRDQFGPELKYFSQCILDGKDPEPSGVEGLIDVHIIRSLYQSSETGQPVRIEPPTRSKRPSMEQEIHEPPIEKPEEVHAEGPKK